MESMEAFLRHRVWAVAASSSPESAPRECSHASRPQGASGAPPGAASVKQRTSTADAADRMRSGNSGNFPCCRSLSAPNGPADEEQQRPGNFPCCRSLSAPNGPADEEQQRPGIRIGSGCGTAMLPGSIPVDGEEAAPQWAASNSDNQRMKVLVQAVQASLKFTPKTLPKGLSSLRRSLAPYLAEITFDCGSTQYCIIQHNAEPSMLYEHVILPEWGLQTPKLIVSVMGGDDMQLDERKFDADGFSKGLVEAALRTGAWVITGGMKRGVMDMVGKAMKRHDKQRRVPCIGISPFWGLTTRWQEVLRKGKDCSKVDAAEAKPPEGDPAEVAGKLELAEVQDDHTHCIIVDDNMVGGQAFGSESAFRTDFECYLASARNLALPQGPSSRKLSRELDGLSPMFSSHRASKQAPCVMILFNGDRHSLEGLVGAIKLGCPIVLCEGTGRLADLLSDILRSVQEDPDRNTNELFKRARELHMKNEGFTSKDRGMVELIIKSGLARTYGNKERLEDVILEMVLDGPGSDSVRRTVDIGRQVFLAVQWGCTDHFDTLGRQLLQECGTEHGGHNKAFEFVFRHIVKGSASSKVALRQAECKSRGIFITWLLKNQRKQLMEFDVLLDNLGKIEWNHLAGGTKGLEGLLLWSIEHEAPASVLEAIWMHMEDPVHAALIAANALRETADSRFNSFSCKDTQTHKNLDGLADRFERLAVLMLEDLEKRGKGVDYLFQDSNKWKSGGQSCCCFRLAAQLECKKFVATTFYSQAVDRFWWTPSPFHIKRRQLHPKFVSFWKLPCLLRNPGVADFKHWELLSIPAIKIYTHGLTKLIFVAIYSYAVLSGQLVYNGIQPIKVVLFLWGWGLGKEEVRQFLDKNSFRDYIQDFWNALDVTYISLMMGALLMGVSLADGDPETNNMQRVLEVIHAVCLLPSWLRGLQPLQMSMYFGTLIKTIFGMVKDALRFFLLMCIINCAFSCALTPILFDDPSDREAHGWLWTLWMFVGESSRLDKFRGLVAAQESSVSKGLIQALLGALALSNVLLLNLLIAMMNSTYEQNQEASQTEWALYRINAVLEYEGGQKLPPPLNLLESFLLTEVEEPRREPQRRLSWSRTSVDLPVSKRELKDSQQRAVIDVGLEEDLGEEAVLRSENTDLRRRNAELASYIMELERLAAAHEFQDAGPPVIAQPSVSPTCRR